MNDLLLARLVENWERDDPRLGPKEKETTIRFAKDEDRAIVHTDEAGVGRRLLAHPDSVVEEVAVLDRGDVRRVAPDEADEDDEPVGVRVTLPIGALSVRSSARKSPQHSAVISDRVLDELPDPEPEAFTDGGVIVDASRNDSREYLVLVECPLCGEDWREDLAKGDHYPEDVAEHLREEHGAAVSGGIDQ